MYCKKAKYLNYRNIEEADIELENGVNVLRGFNAQGKTNILEGIYYFACGKSFRGVTDKELIRLDAPYAEAVLEFKDSARERTHTVRFFEKERKACFKEGIKVSKMSEFIGVFRAVLFSPEHLGIVKEGPSERRSFIDIALSQLYPAYVDSLSKYKRLLMQRNALLKNQEAQGFDELISVISTQMAREAAFIASHREKYTETLSGYVGNIISDMTGGGEKCSLSYERAFDEEEYLKKFSVNLEKEKAAKTTLYGVHKDDIDIKLNGLDSKVYASQGQQRSIALAMKIAEGEISKDKTGEYPVFLFDDILSELDEKRKSFILSGLEGRQVIITGCDDIKAGRTYKIEKGRVIS